MVFIGFSSIIGEDLQFAFIGGMWFLIGIFGLSCDELEVVGLGWELVNADLVLMLV